MEQPAFSVKGQIIHILGFVDHTVCCNYSIQLCLCTRKSSDCGSGLVTKSCPALCDPVDCSLSGSSVHGISQARRLEWVAISPSRESSWPRDWTHVSCLAGLFFTIEPPGKPHWRTTALYFLLNSAITYILSPVFFIFFMVSFLSRLGRPRTSLDWLHVDLIYLLV